MFRSVAGTQRGKGALIPNRVVLSLQTAGTVQFPREARIIARRLVSLTTGVRLRYWYILATPASDRQSTATVIAIVIVIVIVMVMVMVMVIVIVIVMEIVIVIVNSK